MRKLLELDTEGLTADCVRRKIGMSSVQPGTDQIYEIVEEWCRN
jgi:hypothetical protein